MVAPEPVERDFADFEFLIPCVEARGRFVLSQRFSNVFGFDRVELYWFVVDDEFGLFGVGVEGFGWAVYY